MSVIAWPGFGVASFRWSRTPKAAVFSSIFGSQTLAGASPVWEVEMRCVPQYWQQSIAAQSFIESLDGYTNQLALWNLYQPEPAGTMRGSLTLGFATSQGAPNVWVFGGPSQAGKTLLPGDLIGIGSGLTQQVLRISTGGTADSTGLMNVLVNTPVRNAIAAGSAVTWDRPKALFRQKSLAEGIEFVSLIGQSWSLSLTEDFRP